jgi:archaellum component FlaC
VLVQEVADKAWPIVKREAEDLKKDLAKADAQTDPGKRKSAIEKALDDYQTETAKKLIVLACDVFETFAKTKSSYRTYQLKRGFKIVVDGAGLAAALALTSVAGWTGLGTVVGALLITRSVAGLGQEIMDTWREADKIQKRIEASAERLKKQLGSSEIQNTKKQLRNTVVSKLLATEIDGITDTVGKLEQDFELLKNKIKGIKTNAVLTADKLPKLMAAQAEADEHCKPLRQLGVRTRAQQPEMDKLEAALKKVEDSLDKALKEIVAYMEKLNTAQEWVKKHHGDAAILKKKFDSSIVKDVEVLVEVLILAEAFVTGSLAAGGQAIERLGEFSKVTAAMALANDGLSTLKDVGVRVYDKFKA